MPRSIRCSYESEQTNDKRKTYYENKDQFSLRDNVAGQLRLVKRRRSRKSETRLPGIRAAENTRGHVAGENGHGSGTRGYDRAISAARRRHCPGGTSFCRDAERDADDVLRQS